jgi:hypothetical protein
MGKYGKYTVDKTVDIDVEVDIDMEELVEDMLDTIIDILEYEYSYTVIEQPHSLMDKLKLDFFLENFSDFKQEDLEKLI